MTLYSDALAWTLLHFIWQATAIAVVYKYVARRYEICPASTQYNITLVALLSMAAIFSFTAIYECMRLAHLAAGYFPSGATIQHSSGPGEYQFSLLFAGDSLPFFQWIDVFWLAGCLSLLFRSIGGQWIHYRTHRNGYFIHSGQLYERFIVLAQRMHLNELVCLRVHLADTSPFVSGFFRSIVYLPLSVITDLPMEQLECVLTHELAHIQRADYLWNVFQTVMESLFFFHPVVWWVGRILREQRELCCDAVVVESCPNPTLYAKALLNLAEIQYRHHASFAVPATGQHGPMQLLHRVRRILGDSSPCERPTSARPYRNVSLASLAVAVLVSCFFILASSNSAWLSHSMVFGRSISSVRIEASPIAGVEASVPRAKTFSTLVKENPSASLHNMTSTTAQPQRSDPYTIALTTSDGIDHAHRHSHPHEHHHHHHFHDSDV